MKLNLCSSNYRQLKNSQNEIALNNTIQVYDSNFLKLLEWSIVVNKNKFFSFDVCHLFIFSDGH